MIQPTGCFIVGGIYRASVYAGAFCISKDAMYSLCRIDGRLVIMEGKHSYDMVKASCWIEAKKNFGFPLTALQEEMLSERLAPQ